MRKPKSRLEAVRTPPLRASLVVILSLLLFWVLLLLTHETVVFLYSKPEGLAEWSCTTPGYGGAVGHFGFSDERYYLFPPILTANPRDVWAPTDEERNLAATRLDSEIQSHLLPRSNITNEPHGSVSYISSQREMENQEIISSMNGLIRMVNGLPQEEGPPGVYETKLGTIAEVDQADQDRYSRTPQLISTIVCTASLLALSSSAKASAPIQCEFPGCKRTFEQRHEYNRHMKSHTHPIKCPRCGIGFETAKDVNRHINSVHTTTHRYFCTYVKCKHSRSWPAQQRKGFPRKDNWRRHMKNRHALSEDEIRGLEKDAKE